MNEQQFLKKDIIKYIRSEGLLHKDYWGDAFYVFRDYDTDYDWSTTCDWRDDKPLLALVEIDLEGEVRVTLE